MGSRDGPLGLYVGASVGEVGISVGGIVGTHISNGQPRKALEPTEISGISKGSLSYTRQ